MALVSAKGILDAARDGHYAVPAININNLEWTKAVLSTAQAMNSPILIAVSEGAAKYMTGFKTIVGMVNGMMEELNITVPVALHLDHGSFEGAKSAIAAGFTSVMYDGSHLEIEENLKQTREIVALAHAKGVSVEAEVGSIGGEEDGIVGSGELADPAECKTMTDTGIDFLAAGIGNIHGKYPSNWAGLSFDTLENIKAATGAIPLVLHGGTGIPVEQIKKAIDLGVSKINVNTELQLVFAAATRDFVVAGKDLEGKNYDPRKLLAPGYDAMVEAVKEKIDMFGSANKA
ncbi:MAG: class II fructose-1,6-bisphosphate aldolase [Erysipelothrix sp.]|nr:class II fructose-1,6-bisphosphate aldolase [Erysipelothrix sp.]